MKALLFLLTVLFAVWLWRRSRQRTLNERAAKSNTSANTGSAQTSSDITPSPMQACVHCGLHMPVVDMVKGHRGHYCSQAHCQAASDTPA